MVPRSSGTLAMREWSPWASRSCMELMDANGVTGQRPESDVDSGNLLILLVIPSGFGTCDPQIRNLYL